MNITLFIDESGDFTNFRKDWILGGLLCFSNYADSNKVLANVCSPLPSNLGLSSIKDFHLTEIRRSSNSERTSHVSSALFKTILKSSLNCKFLGVINESKRATSDSEKNYRLMLLDLVAIAEAQLTDVEKIKSFELIIATRTKNGKRLTTLTDVELEISNNFRLSFEEGLVSKGLVEIAAKNVFNIELKYANDSWGLVAADFISNTISNRNNFLDKVILDDLQTKEQYFYFESFGGVEERRARIAERDGNYINALTRWIQLDSNNAVSIARKTNSIKQIVAKINSNNSVRQFQSTLEAVIENLWRKHKHSGEYQKAYQELIFLKKNCFNEVLKDSNKFALFLLNNRLLHCLDHLGEIDVAAVLISEQNELAKKVALTPDGLHLLFDFYLFEIDYYSNCLFLELSNSKAQTYFKIIENYKSILTLLDESNDISSFDSNRLFQRSQNTLLRTTFALSSKHSETDKQSFCSELENINYSAYNSSDKARFLDLKLSAYIKYSFYEKAFDTAKLILLEKNNEFDIYYLLRLINDYSLSGKNVNTDLVTEIESVCINYPIKNKHGHPFELINRELGLLYFIKYADKSRALSYLNISESILNKYGAKASPVIFWLKKLSDAHKDYITSKSYDIIKYTSGLEQTDLFNLIRKYNVDSLYRLRIVSPY